METLLSIAVAMFAGLMMSRVVKPLKLPAVTGYLIAGLLIGPFALGALGLDGLGFTSLKKVEGLKVISEVALGFIAFDIGNEFRLSELKKTGKQAAIIGVDNDEILCSMSDTPLSSIVQEMRHYRQSFRDKTVYCNCDNPNSYFVIFFIIYFYNLGLKRLIATVLWSRR